MPRLRIAIATAGRFHVLDLARELAALGHEVRFYSYVPRKRAERFGLPRECHRSLLPFVWPVLLARRYGPRRWRRRLDHVVHQLLNGLVRWKLEPCDVFICMSGIYLEAAEYARTRYGALVYLERGSRHIESQKSILESLAKKRMPVDTVDGYSMKRELAGYDLADTIVVPSRQAMQSFVEYGVEERKLFRNPYGVDLTMFLPTPVPESDMPVLLYVGAWSYQKGVDVLVRAWQGLRQDACLLHVGAAGDATMPRDVHFRHHDPVPQWELMNCYGQAHLFVLASRQEGLSLVLAQALACGVPVVCTDRTGGEDLKALLPDPSWVKVVPADDPDALAEGIREMLPRALALKGTRDLLGEAREQLTWAAYGRRYGRELERAVAEWRRGAGGKSAVQGGSGTENKQTVKE